MLVDIVRLRKAFPEAVFSATVYSHLDDFDINLTYPIVAMIGYQVDQTGWSMNLFLNGKPKVLYTSDNPFDCVVYSKSEPHPEQVNSMLEDTFRMLLDSAPAASAAVFN